LITGAGGGMGRAIALALADAGCRIAVNDRSMELLGGVTNEFRERTDAVVAVAADVTVRSEVASMVETVVTELGSIDVLVNNAGVLCPTRFVDIPEDEWHLVVGVNLTGTFLCSQAVVPQMQRRGWGRVVNLSSTAGKNVSTVGGAHYTAAKAGVLGLTRHLAKEVAAEGITVNAVCPGLIDTEMVHATITPEATQAYANSFPIPRLGAPQEVADLVAFLASDRAAYITGASLDINGGDLMI
jgi:NAD(P)-dependent dehydrogenase (short-subunit alcohol dehydrogenase family)